jgi:hypothetical protein
MARTARAYVQGEQALAWSSVESLGLSVYKKGEFCRPERAVPRDANFDESYSHFLQQVLIQRRSQTQLPKSHSALPVATVQRQTRHLVAMCFWRKL